MKIFLPLNTIKKKHLREWQVRMQRWVCLTWSKTENEAVTTSASSHLTKIKVTAPWLEQFRTNLQIEDGSKRRPGPSATFWVSCKLWLTTPVFFRVFIYSYNTQNKSVNLRQTTQRKLTITQRLSTKILANNREELPFAWWRPPIQVR